MLDSSERMDLHNRNVIEKGERASFGVEGYRLKIDGHPKRRIN